jgi:hypothetical protein
MPNTRVVRSTKSTGMNKMTGGVPSQGLPADANSTYPEPRPSETTMYPEDMVGDMVANAPVNTQYYGRVPSVRQDFGSVDLGCVNGKAK